MTMDSKLLKALEILQIIALSQTEKPVSAKYISQNTTLNMSIRGIENYIKKLVKHGILKSFRGANGGFTFNKEKRKISFFDIYLAIYSDDENDLHNKSMEGFCSLFYCQDNIESHILEILKKHNLHDLQEYAKSCVQPQTEINHNDFTI